MTKKESTMKLLTNLKKLSAIAAVTIGLSTTAYADTLKIGVSVPAADHGWTAGLLWWANHAAEDLAKKYDDTEFFVVAANSGTKQVADVEDLMVKGIDALVVIGGDGTFTGALIFNKDNISLEFIYK